MKEILDCDYGCVYSAIRDPIATLTLVRLLILPFPNLHEEYQIDITVEFHEPMHTFVRSIRSVIVVTMSDVPLVAPSVP